MVTEGLGCRVRLPGFRFCLCFLMPQFCHLWTGGWWWHPIDWVVVKGPGAEWALSVGSLGWVSSSEELRPQLWPPLSPFPGPFWSWTPSTWPLGLEGAWAPAVIYVNMICSCWEAWQFFSRFHTLGESDYLQINSRLSHIHSLLLRAAMVSGAYHIHSKPLILWEGTQRLPKWMPKPSLFILISYRSSTHTLSCSPPDHCCFSVSITLLPLPHGSCHFLWLGGPLTLTFQSPTHPSESMSAPCFPRRPSLTTPIRSVSCSDALSFSPGSW